MSPDTQPNPGLPHWTLPTEAGRLCPYCRFELQAHEQVIVCPSCHTPHHLECWVDNGRCTTYGCSEVAAPGLWRRLERPSQFIGLRLPSPRPRDSGDAFDMRAYVFALIFWWLFGSLALMLALDLREYLRTHSTLPAPQRRRMTLLYWCGLVLGVLQIALLVYVLVRFLLVLPGMIAPSASPP